MSEEDNTPEPVEVEPGEKTKRKYTMSPAAHEARVANAQLSTGPKTDEGKAASSRNAYIHGNYSILAQSKEWAALAPMWKATGKPCRTTCDKYPCSLVDDEITKPGQNCMDKQVFVQAFDAVMNSLHSGDAQHAHGMMANIAASSVEILLQIRDEIASNGVSMMIPVVDKKGEVVKDANDEPIKRPVLNPTLPHYTKLLDSLGVNLPELMMTPRAVSKLGQVEDTENAFATMLGNALQRAGNGPVRRHTIDVTPKKG